MTTTTISVRGEARHVVPPDFAVIAATILVRNPEEQAALERAGRVQAEVVDGLGALGGTVLSVDSIDAPLTWSVASFGADREEDHDERKQRRFVGWRVYVPVSVTVRDLERLTDVAGVLTATGGLELHGVHWQVDPRNPAWPVVRAAAITDAIAKARDYARALDGSITELVHVADAGLLGGPDRLEGRLLRGASASGLGYSANDRPNLDPPPQEISAVIEARFDAQLGPL